MTLIGLLKAISRLKPIESMMDDPLEEGGSAHLARSITLFQLTMLGVGATVGTGIFVILGDAVPKAGPGVILSFIIAGITAGLSALCYAELSSSVPVSGSSYSYTYATMGELVAYLVGWCLLLEYGVSCSAIAVGCGQYMNELAVDLLGVKMPDAIANPPGVEGGLFNLPAVILTVMACFLLVKGTRESASTNALMVLIKIVVLLMFVAIGLTAFRSQNLHPFMPLGMTGVGAAASTIFFSYIGIDAISTASEEVQNPRHNLPLAIILTLVIVTTLYILVAVASVGAQPYTDFNDSEASMAAILRQITGARWPSLILSLGAIISIFSVLLVNLYGQTRILFVMARDGLMPRFFTRVNAKTKTPVQNTLLVCSIVAIAAAIFPLDVLADLTSMGTLVAFGVVSLGVLILRRRRPELSSAGFRVPFYPVTPILSALFCLYLITGLSRNTFILFGVWITVAILLYFSFGHRHSALAEKHVKPATAD